MTSDLAPPPAASTDEILITRLFDAARELVFQAWADPEHLQHWFAPHGCTLELRRWELRPGGTFHLCIRNPRFHDCWTVGTYLEIQAPERLVYTLAVADEQGNRIIPSEAGMDPEWPAETRVTLDFEDRNGQTQLTLRQTVNTALAQRTGAYPSWLQMLDRLAERLQAERAVE